MKVTAKISGFVGFGGRSVKVTAGDEYDEREPLVQAARHLFSPPLEASAESEGKPTRIRRTT